MKKIVLVLNAINNAGRQSYKWDPIYFIIKC